MTEQNPAGHAPQTVQVKSLREGLLIGTRVSALHEIVETDVRTAHRLAEAGVIEVVTAEWLEGVDVEALSRVSVVDPQGHGG